MFDAIWNQSCHDNARKFHIRINRFDHARLKIGREAEDLG